MSAVPPWRRRIGFVFQNYALWPHMTIAENVSYGLKLRKLSRAEIATRTEEALALVGLGSLGGRQPGQLSGGQQQRVALARALALQPGVLLLDEPLSNLDAKLRLEMRREIRRIQTVTGITAVYVTHDQEEALEISDEIAVMNHGRVEQVGAPEEIYDRPVSTFVATFVGAISLFQGVVATGGLRLGDGLLLPLGAPGVPGEQVTIGIRPEQVSLLPPEAAPLRGQLLESSYLGKARHSIVELAPGVHLRVEHRTRAPAAGTLVGVRIDDYRLIAQDTGTADI
jgi:ABC-type Fe3+/spermidine/putrescine transport system ATPase subunit